MEEKKPNELKDEALDAASGGIGGVTTIVTCTLCRRGRVAIPASGFSTESCPRCGAAMICLNGVLQYCIPAQQQATPDVDTDDSWL